MKTKICNKCGKRKLVSHFYVATANLDNRRHVCKHCDRAVEKENRLKRLYQLTTIEYDKLVRQQNKCSLCGEHKRLCIDHNHLTKKVRGLLCTKCNIALGSLNLDNPNQIKKLVKYLKRPERGFRPFQ